MSGPERKKYWDEQYHDYWAARVAEADSGTAGDSKVVAGDSKVPGTELFEQFLRENGFRDGKLLDVGCAWGRMFPLYQQCALEIHGIDISGRIIAEAQKYYGDAVLKEATAEKIPFDDDYFDYVVCLGTFDATYQEEALSEMLRVLKTGGKVILTGKNSNYHADDQAAHDAENGARAKGEPNFFTDVPELLELVEENCQVVENSYYFERRGDFGQGLWRADRPGQFYEFCLVIRKQSQRRTFTKFSSAYSIHQSSGQED